MTTEINAVCGRGDIGRWVSDITYIRTGKDFVYLFLITDAFSRKIVGWNLSGSLKIGGAISALKMAIRQCPKTKEVVHHSDRGIQYCIKDYVKLLQKAKMEISMTEENHCYENDFFQDMTDFRWDFGQGLTAESAEFYARPAERRSDGQRTQRCWAEIDRYRAVSYLIGALWM